MVNSILDKSINYPEIKKIDPEDLDYDATAYEITILDNEKTIALGQPKYAFIEKDIVYFPIYLITDDHVDSQIGVYEIFSTKLISVTDKDGDIDLTKLDEPLLYSSFAYDLLKKPEDETIHKLNEEPEESSPEQSSPEQSSPEQSSPEESSPEQSSPEESSKDLDIISSPLYDKDNAKNWIQNYLQDNDYNIIDNEGGGDCLFAVVRDALSGIGEKITVDELRNKLANEVNNETFLQYKLNYDMFKENFDTLNVQATSLKLRNTEIKNSLTKTKDKIQQTALIKEAQTLKDNFTKVKNDIKFVSDNLSEFKFMKGITTLEQFKELIKTCKFWGDTWAISTLERILNIKIILFSHEMWLSGDIDNVLNCGQLNDTILEEAGIFNPRYYILTDYNGNHYKLITYKQKTALKFEEIPVSIKNLIKNKCLEKNAGPYYLIPEFKEYKEEETIEEVSPLLFNEDTQFQVYGMSADKQPGKGVNEKIPTEKVKEYESLSAIKNWRRKLSTLINQDEDTIKQDPEKVDILKKTGDAKLLQFNKGKSPTLLSGLMETRKTLTTK